MLGVTPGPVSQWKSHWQQGGQAALAAKPMPGPCPRLSPLEHESLARLLLRGPETHGFATGLWTLARVRQVICRHFGVAYDLSGVWHVLRRMNWSCQKPERKARERDEEAIARWRKTTWPRLKKSPPKEP